MAIERTRRKLEARAKKRAAKAAAMAAPGAQSRYALREARRRNGEPVADRHGESRPWFSSLLLIPTRTHAPGFAGWLQDFQRTVG